MSFLSFFAYTKGDFGPFSRMTKTAVKLEKKLYRLTNKREGRKKKKKGVDTLKGRKIKDKRASVRGKRKV